MEQPGGAGWVTCMIGRFCYWLKWPPSAPDWIDVDAVELATCLFCLRLYFFSCMALRPRGCNVLRRWIQECSLVSRKSSVWGPWGSIRINSRICTFRSSLVCWFLPKYWDTVEGPFWITEGGAYWGLHSWPMSWRCLSVSLWDCGRFLLHIGVGSMCRSTSRLNCLVYWRSWRVQYICGWWHELKQVPLLFMRGQ